MMAAMTRGFSYPDKPQRGDAIAVLSLPARLPLPYDCRGAVGVLRAVWQCIGSSNTLTIVSRMIV